MAADLEILRDHIVQPLENEATISCSGVWGYRHRNPYCHLLKPSMIRQSFFKVFSVQMKNPDTHHPVSIGISLPYDALDFLAYVAQVWRKSTSQPRKNQAISKS